MAKGSAVGLLRYYKRYRMELDLRHPRPPAALPARFSWLAWRPELCDAHAHTKYQAFAGEMDAEVFPCLASPVGCRELMTAIVTRRTFCPAATWLVLGPDGPAGTVQGLLEPCRVGAIQNLGVVPAYRGRGLGQALLLKALEGFASAGARRVVLEVTADNLPALRLYRRWGFRAFKTLYRGVETPTPTGYPAGVGT